MFHKSNELATAFVLLLLVMLVGCAPETVQEQTATENAMPSMAESNASASEPDIITSEVPATDTETLTQSAPISNAAESTVTSAVESAAAESETQALEGTAINWAVCEEESELFSIEYPQDWSVDAPIELNAQAPVNVWQFRGEQISPQSIENVTLGRYENPEVSADTSLESWVEQVHTNEFEFERLRAEATEINGQDAYAIHDRITPPERDSYTTYIRCQDQVWFLQTLDVDMESMELEKIYNYMLDSLSLACGE